LRTLPAYIAVLAVYFLLPDARDRPDLLPLWRFLTFTQNIGLAPDPPKAFSHAWSLCVEEQFYLALPVAVILIAPRATARRVATALAAVLLIGMALRGWLWLHDVAQRPFDPWAAPRAGRYMTYIYYPTWTRLDGLLAGVSAAAIQTFRPAWWARLTARCNQLLLCGVLGVVAATFAFGGQIGGMFAATFGFPLIALSMGLLVIGASASASVASKLAAPGVGALATGAYSLYLSHKLVFHYVARAAVDWSPELRSWALAIALGAALIAGAGLYFAVERPFLRLRDHFTQPGRRVIGADTAVAAE
jgi:peptidoglycan/LPS O-acetylase OafA/YrhL